jgi:hypothetical protein
MASSGKIDKSFLQSIDNYGELLQKASVWESNDKHNIFGFVKKSEDDFIYEFYCLITIIADLSEVYKVEYIPGAGEHKNCFPKNPAKKKNRPKFLLFKKNETGPFCQVCPGVRISTKYSPKSSAPDISFQKGNASDTPTYNDLLFIVDAKYNIPSSKKKKLDIGQLYYFSGMIRDLNIGNAKRKINVKFPKLSYIDHNCLITNEDGCVNNSIYSNSHDLKLICFFCSDLSKVKTY